MNHLVIMAKEPRAGRVKTRLAREIGAAEAVRVYRTLLSSLLRRLSADPRWVTWVAVSPDRSIFAPVWRNDVNLITQGQGDLGARMQGLFSGLPPGPVIIIGSDVPGIRPPVIAEGFSALGRAQAAIGPAADGGYWLIGQKRFPRVVQFFENVRWSTPHARSDTLANLNSMNVEFLPELADLDTLSCYRAWRTGVLS